MSTLMPLRGRVFDTAIQNRKLLKDSPSELDVPSRSWFVNLDSFPFLGDPHREQRSSSLLEGLFKIEKRDLVDGFFKKWSFFK